MILRRLNFTDAKFCDIRKNYISWKELKSAKYTTYNPREINPLMIFPQLVPTLSITLLIRPIVLPRKLTVTLCKSRSLM